VARQTFSQMVLLGKASITHRRESRRSPMLDRFGAVASVDELAASVLLLLSFGRWMALRWSGLSSSWNAMR